MWLKVVIVVLFIGLLLSLFTSFAFLINDRDKGTTYRAWYALGVRLGIASLLIGCLSYGIYTGQLGSNAPWDARYAEPMTTPTDSQP